MWFQGLGDWKVGNFGGFDKTLGSIELKKVK
jgi:hypothetical protein